MLARLTERLRRTDRNDGFIIVAVLWILAALATLAAVIAVYVINTATAFAVHDERVQAEALTRASIELSPHNIVRDAEQPASRGAFVFRMGTRPSRPSSIRDARIDLNAAPKAHRGPVHRPGAPCRWQPTRIASSMALGACASRADERALPDRRAAIATRYRSSTSRSSAWMASQCGRKCDALPHGLLGQGQINILTRAAGDRGAAWHESWLSTRSRGAAGAAGCGQSRAARLAPANPRSRE